MRADVQAAPYLRFATYYRYLPDTQPTTRADLDHRRKVVRVMTADPGPGRSRRDDYAESTRAALVDSAISLFTKHGYAATSLDAISKRARVTKGALYHHFTGKQALFEAVFDAVETQVMRRLRQIMSGPEPPWDRALNGLRAYLESCLDPAYQRIAVHEAPVVIGWER